MSISYYTGKQELTMAQYEALQEIDPNKDYNVIDYPTNSISNEQMTFALTCVRLFNNGTTFTCIDNGSYLQGHTYMLKLENGVKSWVDISNHSFQNEIKIGNTTLNEIQLQRLLELLS